MTSSESFSEGYRQKLSPQTLRDIEGLDPKTVGFAREECCGPVPEELIGSMRLTDHVFLASDIPPTEWSRTTDNVEGYNELSEQVSKDVPGSKFNVYYRPGPEPCVLRFTYEKELDSVVCTQYSSLQTGMVPWKSKGVVVTDRSADTFIFVCAHHTRDARCGYCGAVLVDLIQQSVNAKLGEDSHVEVYPCSHVGGHIYAGNVIVYNKHGGVCFGCLTPEDVDALVDLIQSGCQEVPSRLKERVRGRMGVTADELTTACTTM